LTTDLRLPTFKFQRKINAEDDVLMDAELKGISDWAALWTWLVQIGDQRRAKRLENGQPPDRWHLQVDQFHRRVQDRWKQRDSSRQFVLQTLHEFPQASVLDVGAGSGAWTLMMAPLASRVTALDPSAAMLEFCREEVRRAALSNVCVVEGFWPEAAQKMEPHDISLCSHAMYGCPDPRAFIRALERVSRKRVILLLRAPKPDGVMAKAAQMVLGLPYDSPNFQLAYLVLLQMGIFPNVIMENTQLWKPWRSPSLAEALADVKERLGLFEDERYDAQLMDLLRANLVENGQEWVWPAEIRTALLWWDVNPSPPTQSTED
jgi:ubiquinone/menaquinone biosynthesis C-methylase UbiE